MKKNHYTLAMLIQLALYGTTLPAFAAETTSTETSASSSEKQPEHQEDTLVVTAAQQNLQAPGVSTIVSS